MAALPCLLLALSLVGCGDKSDDTAGTPAPEDRDGDGFAAEDCDDDDPEVHPDADELCNEVDDDCDGEVDEDPLDAPTWYADADLDAYGDPALAQSACAAPPGYVADATDCDDGRADIHPGATEDDCTDPTDYNCDDSVMYADADDDGVAACEDCDDADPLRSPLLVERCDDEDRDEDCDGQADDLDDDAEGRTTWFEDADRDGFGAPGTAQTTCDLPPDSADNDGDCDDDDPYAWPGAAPNDSAMACMRDADGDGWGDQAAPPDGEAGSDCDDAQEAVNPGAVEDCGTTYDDDCDGETDAVDALACTDWYLDADRDGYGLPTDAVCACAPSGTHDTTDATDCDDGRADIHPGATEDDCTDPTDYNCDDSVMYADADDDGVAACEDCDDADPLRSPLLVERCDDEDRDEDCDGQADDLDDDAEGRTTWFEDADRDGFGAPGTAQTTCDLPPDSADNDGDCDDDDPYAWPGAAPNDSAEACMRDADGDGWGDQAAPSDGEAGSDCDDALDAVNPGAVEDCATTYDDDCDGETDAVDALACTDWFLDADRDGYGLPTDALCACAPSGTHDTTDATDCDDALDAVNPGAAEDCGTSYDDDCDGETDAVDALACTDWYLDADRDGYGRPTDALCACAPSGTHDTTDATDCDDTRDAVNPGAVEDCGTTYDDDCDGEADAVDAVACTDWFQDADRDGYGLPTDALCACAPSGTHDTTDDTDCDDTRDAVNPGAVEDCGTTYDDDCDGQTDAVDALACTDWYLDADRDGYGLSTDALCACAPVGTHDTTDATDCDDGLDAVNPGAEDVCDEVDNDCDGEADPGCPTFGYEGDYQAESAGGSSSDAAGTLYATTTNDYFGRSLAAGYDFDADGLADVAVAAYGYTYSGSYSGGIFSYEGFPTGTTSSSGSDGMIYGPNLAAGSFGLGLWGFEDFDGDGKDEVALYQRDAGSNDYIWLFEGEDLLLPSAGAWSTWAVEGHSYTGTGPVVGFGEASVTAGVHPFGIANTTYSSSTGYVRLFEVVAGDVGATYGLYGEDAGDLAGQGLAGGTGNDANGDGFDDLFIGAPSHDDPAPGAGAVYVVDAPVTGAYSLSGAPVKIVGTSSADNFGARLSAPGDVDGDGYADLLAGAPQDDDGAEEGGVVFLFTNINPDDASADSAATDATAKIVGEGGYDRIGSYGMEMGDLNGDGALDLVVGAPMSSAGGAVGAGAVWLMYGPLSGTLDLADPSAHDARFLGDGVNDSCGVDLGLGDYDGDGQDDLVMGCTNGDRDLFYEVGTVYLFPGM